jgi:hypothetical protein
MAEPEKVIIDAIDALGVFAKVRWLVAESDSEDMPTDLPLFVLSDSGRDLTAGKTFCGQGYIIRNFQAIIMADTAAQVRTLFEQCWAALSGVASITGATDSYDSEIGAFVCEMTLTY